MQTLLEKIRERLLDRNSPVRTLKGVAEAIGMSEAGFYRMASRDKIKPGTMLALIQALEVDQSYFSDINGSFTPDTMLDKVRGRIVEKDSPIKSLKALAEVIGMSEGGFYMMFKKNTMKLKTKEAICTALNVSQDYFNKSDEVKVDEDSHFGEETLKKMMQELKQEMMQVFEGQLKSKEEQLQSKEEQLKAKDRQIEKLLDLLGKPEGAILSPLSADNRQFGELIEEYTQAGLRPFRRSPFFLPQLAAK